MHVFPRGLPVRFGLSSYQSKAVLTFSIPANPTRWKGLWGGVDEEIARLRSYTVPVSFRVADHPLRIQPATSAASIANIYVMGSHLSDAEGPVTKAIMSQTSMTARTTKSAVNEVDKI